MDQLVPFPPSPSPSGGGPARHPQRIGDAERNAVCATLSAHYAAGRLTADELDRRLGSAVQAVTLEHLRPLLADLPAGLPGPAAAPVPPRQTGLLDPLAAAALVLALLVAAVGFLGLLAMGDVASLVACFLVTVTAAVGAGSATHLLHRQARAVEARAEAVAAQRPRMA